MLPKKSAPSSPHRRETRRHHLQCERRVHGGGRRGTTRAGALTLAVAESLTGGLIASRLVNVAGASTWFRGGLVSYASPDQVRSARCARGSGRERPKPPKPWRVGVRKLLKSDVGLSVTGVAGTRRARRSTARHGVRRTGAGWRARRASHCACRATVRGFAPTPRSVRSMCSVASLQGSTEALRLL